MKNLLIMRHAKSDWDNPSISDFDRPLNNRGKASAPLVGHELLKRDKVPELIISSPANRAKTTSELVSKIIGYKQPIQYENEFYFGSIDEMISIIRDTDNLYKRIMIVGHNPTLEELVPDLTGDHIERSLPTAAIVSINFDFDNWNQLGLENGELEFIIIPKEIIS